MKIKLIVNFALVFICGDVMAQEANLGSDSKQVVAVLNALDAMDLEKKNDYSLKISNIIGKVDSSQALTKLAIACRALSSDNNVGDDPACPVYDLAYWEIVKRISAMNDKNTMKSIQAIMRYSDLQTGDLQRFRELVGRTDSK